MILLSILLGIIGTGLLLLVVGMLLHTVNWRFKMVQIDHFRFCFNLYKPLIYARYKNDSYWGVVKMGDRDYSFTVVEHQHKNLYVLDPRIYIKDLDGNQLANIPLFNGMMKFFEKLGEKAPFVAQPFVAQDELEQLKKNAIRKMRIAMIID